MVRRMPSSLILDLGESVFCIIPRTWALAASMISYCLPALKSILPATTRHISVSISDLMRPLMLFAAVMLAMIASYWRL